MYSSSERFRPAGHKAQELSDVVLPDEVFKPIQRVVDTTITDKEPTIGYLFRDIEYKGSFQDIVMSNGFLKYGTGNDGVAFRYERSEWIAYEADRIKNPLGWAVPSGPTATELCYYPMNEKSTIAEEVSALLMSMLTKNNWVITSTTINYKLETAKIQHDWTGPAIEVQRIAGLFNLLDDTAPEETQFMHALIGKRHCFSKAIFERYGMPAFLLTAFGDGDKNLVLRPHADDFFLDANSFKGYGRTFGVAPIANFSNDHYEVRDA
ncbi:TPA: hypothetical protein HA251_02385 [Candidatus Woesearchaeota archaeon]|nr:hypothetical protein [Candidatus Woesearchaeota archaeon]